MVRIFDIFVWLLKNNFSDSVITENIVWSHFSSLAKLANLSNLQSLEVKLLLSPELTVPDNINSMYNHFFKQLSPNVNRQKQRIVADLIKLLLPLIVVKDDKEPPEFILSKTQKLVNQDDDISCSVLSSKCSIYFYTGIPRMFTVGCLLSCTFEWPKKR